MEFNDYHLKHKFNIHPLFAKPFTRIKAPLATRTRNFRNWVKPFAITPAKLFATEELYTSDKEDCSSAATQQNCGNYIRYSRAKLLSLSRHPTTPTSSQLHFLTPYLYKKCYGNQIPLDWRALRINFYDDEIYESSDEDSENVSSIDSIRISDFVQFGENIEYQRFPEYILEGDCIDLNVAEVYDPSKFWYNMHFKLFNELMEQLQTFYSDWNEAIIPESDLQVGMFCASLLLGKYHRALVVNLLIHTTGLTKVYFVDLGTVANVQTSKILYLYRRFVDVPQQAMRGRLAGVFPVKANSIWPREATNKFFALIKDVGLVGKVEKIDRKKRIVHFTLIEANYREEDDFIINEELVAEGLAVRTPQEQQTNQSFTKAMPLVTYLHLVPTFEELEFGLCLNSLEMSHFLKMGMSMEILLPQYFKSNYTNHSESKSDTPKQRENMNKLVRSG